MSKKDELTASLSATLLTGMLKLPPSELKKAQEVVAGENRPDLTLGAKPTAAPAPVEIPAPPAKKEATPSIAVATQVLRNLSLQKPLLQRVQRQNFRLSNALTFDFVETKLIFSLTSSLNFAAETFVMNA
jgi:hypothetical protein